MAELNQQGSTRNRDRSKSTNYRKIKSTRVDLTPMVDLGFLLITFFMVTTSWSQPRAMNIIVPAKGDGMPIKESVSLTIIPLSGDQVFYYEGSMQDAMRSGHAGKVAFAQGVAGIRQVISDKQLRLDRNPKFPDGRKDLFVTIKPLHETSYQSVISSLDEMTICDVKKFALVDITPEEIKWLSEMNIH